MQVQAATADALAIEPESGMMRAVRETTYGEFKTRKQETLWHRLNRLVTGLVIVAALVTIACFFLPLLSVRRDQAARVERLKSKIEGERLALQQQEREVKLLQHDPEYIELMARDRLDMMKVGETVFRLDPPPRDTSEFRLRETP